MGFFSKKDGEKKKSKKGRNDQEEKQVEHVVEIKTVGDIGPVIETRKLIGNNEYRSAVILAYNAAKNDYIRYFSENSYQNESNRYFFIRSLKEFGIDVPDTGYVDSHAITDAASRSPKEDGEKTNKFNALRKLSAFYLDLYEKARFSKDYSVDEDTILKRLTDIYNYMDITKLYFPDVEKRTVEEN